MTTTAQVCTPAPLPPREHQPTLTRDGGLWAVSCDACSWQTGERTYPCRIAGELAADWPPKYLMEWGLP